MPNAFTKTINIYARRKDMSVWKYLLVRFLETLSLTIPGFIIVLLFPIRTDVHYGWWSGMWQGWFGLCNMVIHLFSPDTLYYAVDTSQSYDICWWVFFIWAVLALPGFLIVNLFTFREKQDLEFVNPSGSVEFRNDKIDNDDNKQRSSIKNRTIKVFISSTFRDMQKERDYLMTHVFPRLQEMALSRNVQFIPVDLRWGITEEEANSGNVLELCLQEIDNSIPFFIGIIGDRYGWKPSVEEFYKSQLLQQKYPWVKDDFSNGLSITEIEMQYGVLRRKERINAVFFSESSTIDMSMIFSHDDRGKIAALKRAILFDGRYPIIEAISPEEIGARVMQIFTKYLDLYFPILPTLPKIYTVEDDSADNDLDFRKQIELYFARYGKKLSLYHLNTIVDYLLSHDSVILKTLLNELLVFGKYEELDGYIAYWLEAKTPLEFYEKVLERAEIKYGVKPVKTFFALLRVSGKTGININDVLEKSEVPYVESVSQLGFSLKGIFIFLKDNLRSVPRQPFHQYFSDYIRQNDNGNISLDHSYMEHAVDVRYLPDDKAITRYHKLLMEEL